MKLKNFFEFLGFRGKTKCYPYKINDVDLGDGVTAHYAQWQHPNWAKCRPERFFSPELVQGYAEFVKEGDFCIDIGANHGDTTLSMAIAAGKSGFTLALEPNPHVYHVLEKNARANRHISNIQTMLAGASSEEGFLEFEYSDSGFGNGGRHEGISAFKHSHPYKLLVFVVDFEKELKQDFSDHLPRLKFIKVDAEGYDLVILKTLKNIISEYRPVVKTEVFRHTSEQYRSELLSFFGDLDYSLYKMNVEPLGRGDELSPENLGREEHYDVVCLPAETIS